MNGADDVCDILTTLIFVGYLAPGFRVADVVEMNAVDVIAACKVATETSKIIGCAWQFWVHVAVLANLFDEVWNSLAEMLTTCTIPFAHRNGYYPCVELHTTFVTLFDSECKSIIAWGSAGLA